MAYEIRSEKGLPITKQGSPVLAMDALDIKIEQLDEKKKSFVAVASTEHEDRDNDIVRQDGWKLTNFRKNPVVPWSHNYYGVPIAKASKIWIDKENKKGPRLLFIPQFDENDDDSMKVFNKYKNGFLTSFSVGFRGIEFEWRNEEDLWFGGREFTKQELLEVSAVAVPANPHANTRLNYAGDNAPDNLIQMGYPEVFAKTKTGLFYPVRDMAILTQPKEFEVDKGVIGINAVSLDDEIKVSDPVAYLFDPELFDDDIANKWVKENVKEEIKIKYFDLKNDKKDDFSLECVTEESKIKYFEKSVDFSDIEMVEENLEDKNDDVDEIKTGDVDTKKEDKEGKSSEDDKDESTIIPMKQIIEITTMIKDPNNKVIDQYVEMIASNKEFESVSDYLEWKSNEIISVFINEIKELKKQIEDLSNNYEKTVAHFKKILDNKQDSDIDDLDDKSSNNDGDMIELDTSLINSPDDNDKTNLNDEIEIDDDILDKSKADIKETVNDALVNNLKQSLREVFLNASGKID